MLTFLTYITGFFMNFELLPVLTDYANGTFWLKIEQFWSFEEISIFSSGSHFGYRTALTDTNMKGDHLRIIQTNMV
jgi:hypothetical protein